MPLSSPSGSRDSWLYENLLKTGEESFSRELATSNVITLNTGVLRLCYFTARKTETTTQVRVITGSAGAAATPTLCRIGLWQVAADGSGPLVAATDNDTTLFPFGGTAYTRFWATPYAKKAGLRYAVGILVVTGTTPPSVLGEFIPVGSEVSSIAPVLTGAISGSTDLPDPLPAPGIVGNRPYAAVLP